MTVEKIYHIGDLHIRNLQRHKEYRAVFKRFLTQVKKDKIDNSLICILGDIAHAKLEMSPELVKEISWFLTECAKLRETIVITGNHDCNLNNSHRLDVLTPIIENLQNPKIHYLRDTGVYDIHNITFVVYSILDKEENWPDGRTIQGENKICLFHGPVRKADTDIGFKISSHAFDPEIFDGFDIVLMGDIHRRQTLQQYDKANDKPIMAYVGSMVQQNHGELLEKHGYLLWDVKSRSYEAFDLKNDYGYLTVDVNKGKIPKWVKQEINTKLPKYPRLRLRFSNTQAPDMKKCITELKKMFKVTEVTVTRTDTIGSLKTGFKVNKNIVGNVKDEAFQNSLIHDYLERSFLLDDDDLKEITRINTEINGRIDDSDIAENILWTPKTFEFENMFSYGGGNKIEFDRAQGIVGIFAPNTSGKSSLFDALCFCIYDKTNRTFTAKNIINNRKNEFKCKFTFDIDGIEYTIERKAKWVRKGAAVKVDVDFYKDDGGIITSLNGEQRRDTNKNIEKYLGKFEDFILTSLSVQGNNALFIDKSQSERKDTLSQFIGVDIFDKLYQIAQDENRDNSTIIRKFKANDFTDKLATIEVDLEQCDAKYKELTSNIKELKSSREEINKILLELSSKLVNLKSGTIGIDELKSRRLILSNKLSELESEKEKHHERLAKLEELQIKLDEILDGLDEEQLEVSVNENENLKLDLKKYQDANKLIKVKIDSLTDRKNHLDEHEYDPECKYCVKNSDSIIKSKETVETELKALNEKYKANVLVITDIKNKMIGLYQDTEDWKLYIDTKDKESKVDNEISNILNKLTIMETDEVTYTSQLEIQKNLIHEYFKNEKQIKENTEIQAKIDEEKSKLDNINDEIDSMEHSLLSYNGKISSYQSQKKTIEAQVDEVRRLEKENKLYEYYLNALSRNGISYELIEKALPMIEGEVNNILAQIVEFGMQLEMDGKNINAYIVYGDQKWALEMCSGMEKFISGLAIRVALINVCNLPRPNFLVIDEGFGTLDAENLQSLFMLFTYLKTQFDFVMVISHIDSMRDVVDDLIEIKKENGFSQIKF